MSKQERRGVLDLKKSDKPKKKKAKGSPNFIMHKCIDLRFELILEVSKEATKESERAYVVHNAEWALLKFIGDLSNHYCNSVNADQRFDFRVLSLNVDRK